ncbi:putative beta-lactamase-like 1 [Nematostella vectensis]|uniref:putative beta-lactamase-like 1 n=1 Tax=Nematostella vectensis TaxID=45351 RepID=UPI002077144B|nr:putative beta-lactamase-like 1 [Nematostella vectensis]XP_048579154.1 putative beta-lactamase-like 1 [Nematostella vectensis]XP_048579156.1 putative beta-lactamase-like 1 [Nematostella vectensis]
MHANSNGSGGGQINSVSMTSLAQFPSSASTIGFLPDELSERKMVTWQARKARQVWIVLAFFVLLALIMTGLYIWRSTFYRDDSSLSSATCNSKRCTTGASSSTPMPTHCYYRAQPKMFDEIPNPVRQVLDQIEGLMNKSRSASASVVYMDRVIWRHFHGVLDEDVDCPKPPDKHSLFPVASITKVFNALMVFKLYNERKIETLDDDFVLYEPKFHIKNPFDSQNTTIRQLLTHMAGLPREAPCAPHTPYNLCPYNHSVILERIKHLSQVVRAGSKPYYSNLGAGLLGQGIASWLNSSYDAIMENIIFRPLQLNDSTFHLTPKLKERVPAGYMYSKRQSPMDWGWLDPAAGLFTSLADIEQVELDLLRSFSGGEGFLEEAIAHDFFAPAFVLSDDKNLVGMPWEMTLFNGYLLRKKNGYVYGYWSDIHLVPELQLALNIFATGIQEDTGKYFKELVSAFHEVLSTPDKGPLTPQDPAPFIGKFVTKDIPTVSQMEIALRGNRLNLVVHQGLYFSLNYLTERTFEIWDRRHDTDCMSRFILGVNMEKLYFEPISNVTHLSPGFKVLGFHPSGLAYFNRTA